MSRSMPISLKNFSRLAPALAREAREVRDARLASDDTSEPALEWWQEMSEKERGTWFTLPHNPSRTVVAYSPPELRRDTRGPGLEEELVVAADTAAAAEEGAEGEETTIAPPTSLPLPFRSASTRATAAEEEEEVGV